MFGGLCEGVLQQGMQGKGGLAKAKMEADALACKELISKYGPILTEVPYQE